MKKTVAIVVFLMISSFSFSQDDANYTKTLNKMFERSGTMNSLVPAVREAISSYKDDYPNLNKKDWEELEKEFINSFKIEFSQILAPIYKKHFTEQDLKEIIKFYESPIGIKLASKLLLISEEFKKVNSLLERIEEQFIEKIKSRDN